MLLGWNDGGGGASGYTFRLENIEIIINLIISR